MTNILPSIIDAFSTIAAATIGAGYLSKGVERAAKNHFITYSDKTHDLNDFMQKATLCPR